MTTGYLHQNYARSLSEFGEPLALHRSGGWLLKRAVDGSAADAMGLYPLFACSDWRALRYDLDQLTSSLVSVVVVTDPFGDYDETLLGECFGELMTPFKTHYVTDLGSPATALSAHHARNVRIAQQQVAVERCEEPESYLDDWVTLYSVLIRRHQINGIRAFSRQSFSMQLRTPGMICFRAAHEEQTVGMNLWYLQNGVAYYHLGAYTEQGYDLRASFALFREALEYFAACGLAYANLGAGAGIGGDGSDGLSRFKRGWSTTVRTAYLCGRILDHQKYRELTRMRSVEATSYFPAYRFGEFN